jgi:hypothetical protein
MRGAVVEALAERVVGLDELITAPHEGLIDAFAAALARRHGVALRPSPWRADELQLREAARARFAPLDPTATIPPTPAS